jgi:hypothetical protein
MKKESHLALETSRIQEFAFNLLLSETSNSISLEIAKLENVKTLRQLVKERPDLAALLKSVVTVYDDREISC